MLPQRRIYFSNSDEFSATAKRMTRILYKCISTVNVVTWIITVITTEKRAPHLLAQCSLDKNDKFNNYFQQAKTKQKCADVLLAWLGFVCDANRNDFT